MLVLCVSSLLPTGGLAGVTRYWTGVIRRVLGLGVVVILTFGALWAPFCFFPGAGAGSGCSSSLGQASAGFISVQVLRGRG